MLSLEQIAAEFPQHLHLQHRAMLREYLQCVVLEILYESPFATQFSFLGGTCLRLVHQNTRFSEDLDFDNFGLTEHEFDEVARYISKELEIQGYAVELSVIHRSAYRCNIRFPGMLFEQGLSGHRTEKILIQFDTYQQGYAFKPETYLLNRFGLFTRLLITPPSLLLAQKLYTLTNRRRAKGRDFFDVVFLCSLQIKPDYGFLDFKMKAGTPELLRSAILKVVDTVDLDEMAQDVQPFLFNPDDARRVRYFREFWETVNL